MALSGTQKLYVANCTKMNRDIHFRVPEHPRREHFTKSCPVGKQILLWEGSTPEIEGIIRQLEPHGFVFAMELKRHKGYTGMIMCLDKPIDIEKMLLANEHNLVIVNERSMEARKLAAVALDNNLNKHGVRADRVAMEIEELPLPGEPATGENPIQTLEVEHEGVEPRPRGRSARGRMAA